MRSAIQPQSIKQSGSGLFDNVQSLLDAAHVAWVDHDTLKATQTRIELSIQNDLLRLADVSDVLYGDDLTAYGARVYAVFSRWANDGGAPSLPAMMLSAFDQLGIDPDSALGKAGLVTALLSEIPNNLQYHGNEHYKKVLFHTIRLIVAHDKVGGDLRLNDEDVGLLLIASCIHDLGHEGGDNLRDGIYTPGAMEQKALDYARPWLGDVGLSNDQMGLIETMVFCTDITFFAGDNSPCVRMKKIFAHYFEGYEGAEVADMMMGKLRRFEDNKKLSLMAMLLHEADVGTSAGVCYEQAKKETIAIMEERGLKTAGAKVLLAFLKDQLGSTMHTAAAKAVFGAAMQDIIAQAEADFERGALSFYA
jgi:hypothetical protein